MSELQTLNQNDLVIWNDEKQLKTIKDIYCKNSNNEEFQTFVNIGKATGLNPFLKEIWFVKYAKDGAASIFIARDGYRRSAQANQNYDYHFVDSVYSNDIFKLNNGQVQHEYKVTDRGNLVGAYCIVKRKSSSQPIYIFVDLKEYDTNKSLWANKKATMIKKVAEAQGLRMAFQELFANTYDESELFTETKQDNVNKAKDKLATLIEGKVFDAYVCTDDVIERINAATTHEELSALSEDAGRVHPDDKSKLREIFKKKKSDLKPTEFVSMLTEEEKIKNQLLKASSRDTLDIAADLISSVSQENQEELRDIYQNRLKEFS